MTVFTFELFSIILNGEKFSVEKLQQRAKLHYLQKMSRHMGNQQNQQSA